MTNILIIGANRGLGLEFVRQFLREQPKNIIATCRQPDKAEALQKLAAEAKDKLHVLQLDVSDFNKYEEVVNKTKAITGDDGIDLLINNAAIMFRDGLDTVNVENMIKIFEVNSVAPLMMTKAALPVLQKSANNNKLVVNMTSKMGSIDDNTSGGYYPYRTSKAALNMITKSLAVDLAPSGINVISLHPGWVKTDMGGPRGLLEVHESVQHMIKTIKNATKEVSGKMLNYDGKVIPW